MSDIRFNQWLHQSGTGGITQVDGGHVGIGTTNPDVAVHTANNKKVNVGVVTANSVYAGNFYGSGANLTSLPSQVTIANNADNRVITGGSGVNLNGEANLTFDGSNVIHAGSDGRRYSFAGDGSSHYMKFDSTLNGIILNGYGGIAFETNGTNERLRIDSSGKIGISRTPTQHPLEIQHASEPTVSLWRGSTKGAALQAQSGGTYLYSYENAPLLFSVNSGQGFTERLRIDSSGRLLVGATSGTARLHIKGSGGDGIKIENSGGTNAATIDLKNTLSSYVQEYRIAVAGSDGLYGTAKSLFVRDQTSGANRFEVQAGGNVRVSTGNLIIGTAGKGIDFSATTNYGTSTPAEILDDYEEGQFLPSYSTASGSITMLTRRGEYCKVGRVVHCMFSCSANGSSNPSGTVTITGLPFTAEIPSANGARGGGGVVFAGYHAPPELATCNANGDTLYLRLNDNSLLQANTSGTGFGYNAYQISGFFSYLTAT